MNVLALCSGVGGIELGIKLAHPSARCVCYVEGEGYASSVLIERMAEEALDQAPIWSDVRTFDGRPWRGRVDCVTGGYPCQPFSLAGNRKGQDDPRHLWPHIKRIIREVEPRRCFFENVAGHLSLGFETVANDLQGMGFTVAAGLFSAEEVGAAHGRERLFIMADAQHSQWRPSGAEECGVARLDDGLQAQWPQSSGGVGNGGAPLVGEVSLFPPLPDEIVRWAGARQDLKPPLCGMAHGLANRLDRIAACGNGVVPLAAAYAWRVLSDSLSLGSGIQIA